MEDTESTVTSGKGFRNIDQLPLGRLLRRQSNSSLDKKKKKYSLASKLRLKGPEQKS